MDDPQRPSWGQPGYPHNPWHYPPPAGMSPGPPYPPAGSGYPGQPPRRPGTVLAATVMTFIGSGLMVLLGLALLAIVASAGDEAVRQFLDGLGVNASVGAARAGVIGAAVGVLVQAGLLILGGVLAHTGRNAGRVILTIIGVINILLNLAQLAGGQAAILPVLVYVVVTLILLWTGGANDWFRARRAVRKGHAQAY